MQNRETRWRTPRKRGQRHSSLHVSRRQPKIKTSSLRRTRGNRTRKRSSRSTRLKAQAKAKARGKVKAERPLAREAQPERDKVKTSQGRWLNTALREKG